MIKQTLSFLFFLHSFFQPASVFASTFTVAPTEKGSSVRKAIEMASPGDKIIIRKGVYREHGILITKPLTLLGEDHPVIDGEGKGEIFTVISSNVAVIGLVIRNVGTNQVEDRAGIKIKNSKNCLIENNNLQNTYFGVYLYRSENCVIKGNTISGIGTRETETGNAIHLWYCHKIAIENNNVSGHRDGIYLEFSDSSLIRGNTSSDHIRYGLHFMFSHNNEYYRNSFRNSGAGVAVMYSRNIYMHENLFADNWSPVADGLLFKDIKDSRIENNIIRNNTIGLYAEGCMRMKVTGNDFIKNGWAVKILGTAEDNIFSGNNFSANTFEVVTNASLNTNLFEKNYWSEYAGYDLDKDGIGDLPHRPVKLFTYLVEQIPSSIILLRSLFVDLLNLAEKVTPVITPENLTDASPLMKEIKRKNPYTGTADKVSPF